MFVHPDGVYVYTPGQRLVHQIGDGVYTDTPFASTYTLCVHPDAFYVYTPRQRLVHHIGAGVYNETPFESTHTVCVCAPR